MSVSARDSAIYVGHVAHTRYRPRKHRLYYRVWYLLLDLDELHLLDRRLPGFTVDRPGPISFWASDHGPRDGSSLRPWAERHLRGAGVEIEGGPIRILAFPRILGYVFNPLSVWFCFDRNEQLRALIYEVSNTFGEDHSYVIPLSRPAQAGDRVRSLFGKELFVSPFVDMDALYDFTTRVPDHNATVAIRETVGSDHILNASLTTRRVALSGRALARVFVTHPLVTAKVIGGIHWEALKLWSKGAPYRRRGAPPERRVSIVAEAGQYGTGAAA